MDERLAQAWRDAAADLGFRVISPFELAVGADTIECEAFLPDFGSSHGALVVSVATERKIRPAVRGQQLWVSAIPARTGGRKYSRRLFLNMLRDFGWFGAAHAIPKWMG